MMPRAEAHRRRRRAWRVLALLAAVLVAVLAITIDRDRPDPAEEPPRHDALPPMEFHAQRIARDEIRVHIHSDPGLYDLSPLAELTNLYILELEDLGVSDLSSLAGITTLISLTIRQCPVLDLAPLRALPALETLHLWDTPVTDLSPLAKVPSITSLWLTRSAVTDLTPLAEMHNLEVLQIRGTSVSDLSPIADLPNLRHLHLTDTAVDPAAARALAERRPDVKVEYTANPSPTPETPLSLRSVMERLGDWRYGLTVVPDPEAGEPGWFERTFGEDIARAVARPSPGDRPGEPLEVYRVVEYVSRQGHIGDAPICKDLEGMHQPISWVRSLLTRLTVARTPRYEILRGDNAVLIVPTCFDGTR